MIIGSSIKKIIYNKLIILGIEEEKAQEIIKFIEEVFDKYWIRMA